MSDQPRPAPSVLARLESSRQRTPNRRPFRSPDPGRIDGAILDALIERVAERVAAVVAARLTSPAECEAGDWLDSRRAAEYLGVHRDTLRKLAAERAIPAEQDGRGCKLFFLRADLDEWRRTGGRATHLSSVLADAA